MAPERMLALLAAFTVLTAGCIAGPDGQGSPVDDSATPATTMTPDSAATTSSTPDETPSPEPTTDGTATPDPGLGEDGYANMFTFRAVRVDRAAIGDDLTRPVSSLPPEKRAVATAALENGSTTVTDTAGASGGLGSPGPLQPDEYLRHDGTVYRVNVTVTDRHRGTGYDVELEGPLRPEYHEDYETATERAVPFDSLSAVQRDLFLDAAPPVTEREDAVVAAHRAYLPPANASLEGWTDGQTHYVRHEGDLFRVRVGPDRPTVVRRRARYTLVPVADSPTAFVTPRLGDLVTNVTDERPREPARSVVLGTLQNGTYEWEGTVETRPERVEAAAAWVRERPPDGNVAYVRYRGDLYRLQVRELIE